MNHLPMASLLGLLFAMSEIGLAFFKRAKAGETRAADRGSLQLLWLIIVSSVVAAYSLPFHAVSFRMARPGIAADAGSVLLFAGLALRWYSIVHLGRFFTVNVAIANDHRLIDTGPYRFVRHPSYTGCLMAFAGLGLCLGNWASLLMICVPTLAVFLIRMNIEETALSHALAGAYQHYMQHTKRLIPFLY